MYFNFVEDYALHIDAEINSNSSFQGYNLENESAQLKFMYVRLMI